MPVAIVHTPNSLLFRPKNTKKQIPNQPSKKKMEIMILACFVLLLVNSSESKSTITNPQSFPSFKINTTATQNPRGCSYTVSISTSCSSVRFTRDQISLSFGDAYGNQVYAPRLDDPSRRTFERCSTDRFEVYGPCTQQICYLYVFRSGYDGWKAERVEVYGYNTKAVSFNYNTFIPPDTWFGFNYCSRYASSASFVAAAI